MLGYSLTCIFKTDTIIIFLSIIRTVASFLVFLYYDYCGGFPVMTLAPFEIRALLPRVCPLLRGLIHVCEKALLVSQTLNSALALITANLWPLLVTINDAPTDSYHRPASEE